MVYKNILKITDADIQNYYMEQYHHGFKKPKTITVEDIANTNARLKDYFLVYNPKTDAIGVTPISYNAQIYVREKCIDYAICWFDKGKKLTYLPTVMATLYDTLFSKEQRFYIFNYVNGSRLIEYFTLIGCGCLGDTVLLSNTTSRYYLNTDNLKTLDRTLTDDNLSVGEKLKQLNCLRQIRSYTTRYEIRHNSPIIAEAVIAISQSLHSITLERRTNNAVS